MNESSQMSKATADLPKDEEWTVPTLATPRLILRSWTADDTAPYTALCQDPRVMRYVSSGRALTDEEVADRLNRYQRFWRRHGFGPFAVVDQVTNELVGSCGLSLPTYAPQLMPAIEIGWRLATTHWGKGFGTEAATAVLDWGFATHDFDAVVAIVHPGNTSGAAVAVRMSMTREQQTTIGTDLNADVFRITKAQWDMTDRT